MDMVWAVVNGQGKGLDRSWLRVNALSDLLGRACRQRETQAAVARVEPQVAGALRLPPQDRQPVGVAGRMPVQG